MHQHLKDQLNVFKFKHIGLNTKRRTPGLYSLVILRIPLHIMHQHFKDQLINLHITRYTTSHHNRTYIKNSPNYTSHSTSLNTVLVRNFKTFYHPVFYFTSCINISKINLTFSSSNILV